MLSYSVVSSVIIVRPPLVAFVEHPRRFLPHRLVIGKPAIVTKAWLLHRPIILLIEIITAATLDGGSSCSCFQPCQHLLQLKPSASSYNPADARTRCTAAQMSCESEVVISEHNNHGSKIRPVVKPLEGSFRLHIIWASSISNQ